MSPIRIMLVCMAFTMATSQAWAHALGAECKQKDGRVEVSAYYDDDTDAQGASVTVFDAAGKKLVEGQTNDKGRWSFPAPKVGVYKVIVNAGGGHRTELKLTIQETASSAPESTPTSAPVSKGPSRQEFTEFPLQRVVIGLGVIVLLCFGLIQVKRLNRPASASAPE